MLQLIVERIRNTVKSPKLARMNNKLYFYFLIDLEVYFYLLVSTLDILAKLTPNFYSEWEGNKNTMQYFSHQRKLFMQKQNSKKDPEYTTYLEDNMNWYEKVKGIEMN